MKSRSLHNSTKKAKDFFYCDFTAFHEVPLTPFFHHATSRNTVRSTLYIRTMKNSLCVFSLCHTLPVVYTMLVYIKIQSLLFLS